MICGCFTALLRWQNEALDELLANSDMLTALAGDLTISSQDARELLANLPADLSPERRAVVETACQLVGKLNYFWGGKSLVLGWDDRWGTLRQVTAAGSPTTGTYRPYGMDCSGYVDWVLYNILAARTSSATAEALTPSTPTAPPSPGMRRYPATWYSTQAIRTWAS